VTRWLRHVWVGFATLALIFAAFPNAQEIYWKLKYGQAWIGVESARMYLQDPTDWRDSVATYGFPLQPGGVIVPFATTTMINVLWTSPEWAGRDIPFVCVEGSNGWLGWIEVRFQGWTEEEGPRAFEWQDEERGGLKWRIECRAEWEAEGFSVEWFPRTGYVGDMEWERTNEEGGADVL
jgi:hypothetical protein